MPDVWQQFEDWEQRETHLDGEQLLLDMRNHSERIWPGQDSSNDCRSSNIGNKESEGEGGSDLTHLETESEPEEEASPIAWRGDQRDTQDSDYESSINVIEASTAPQRPSDLRAIDRRDNAEMTVLEPQGKASPSTPRVVVSLDTKDSDYESSVEFIEASSPLQNPSTSRAIDTTYDRHVSRTDAMSTIDPLEDFDVASGSEKEFLLAHLDNDAPKDEVEHLWRARGVRWPEELSAVRLWDTTMTEEEFEETTLSAKMNERDFGSHDLQEFYKAKNAAATKLDASHVILHERVQNFVQSHKFIINSHGKPMTMQRRQFTRDVYDYARALGMGKNQAEIEVKRARAAYKRQRGLPGNINLDESDDDTAIGSEVNDSVDYADAIKNGVQHGLKSGEALRGSGETAALRIDTGLTQQTRKRKGRRMARKIARDDKFGISGFFEAPSSTAKAPDKVINTNPDSSRAAVPLVTLSDKGKKRKRSRPSRLKKVAGEATQSQDLLPKTRPTALPQSVNVDAEIVGNETRAKGVVNGKPADEAERKVSKKAELAQAPTTAEESHNATPLSDQRQKKAKKRKRKSAHPLTTNERNQDLSSGDTCLDLQNQTINDDLGGITSGTPSDSKELISTKDSEPSPSSPAASTPKQLVFEKRPQSPITPQSADDTNRVIDRSSSPPNYYTKEVVIDFLSTKRFTRASAKSAFFSPPSPESKSKASPGKEKQPRPKGRNVSCIPFPSLSAPRFGLLQEKLASDPFRLLIGITFLNRTVGKYAIPVFYSVMEKYPTPAGILAAAESDIIDMTRQLGLQAQRAQTYRKFAKFWLTDPPVKGKRYRVDHYPKPGDGMDVKKGEILDDADPRMAWEIGHMTQGRYAIDSWRIFCRDVLRGEAEGWNGEGREDGFQPEWMRVLPRDKELVACLKWMWLKEGFDWDPVTGEKEVAGNELMEASMAGKITWDDTGGMRILDMRRTTKPVEVKDHIGP